MVSKAVVQTKFLLLEFTFPRQLVDSLQPFQTGVEWSLLGSTDLRAVLPVLTSHDVTAPKQADWEENS